METYKKTTAESYELVVSSASRESHSYFLRNCLIGDFPEQLDFGWAKKGKIKASLTFAISIEKEAISLPKSPFGGFWIEESLSSSEIVAFLGSVLVDLKKRGVSFIRIVQAPKPYEIQSDLINYLLFKAGFTQEKILSHHFFLGRKKIKKKVQEDQSKFKKKAKDDGVKIQIGPILNFGFLNQIKSWNQSRGYEILFDENRLISQVSEFPDRYFLITLLKDGFPIAHSLTVRLLPDSLYYFLSAINPKCSLKNAGDLMLHCLFQLAVEQKSDFIDLGSSETDSGPNHSLMFFKSRFSNEICNKTSWTLKI